jgi:hypothetical protein
MCAWILAAASSLAWSLSSFADCLAVAITRLIR